MIVDQIEKYNRVFTFEIEQLYPTRPARYPVFNTLVEGLDQFKALCLELEKDSFNCDLSLAKLNLKIQIYDINYKEILFEGREYFMKYGKQDENIYKYIHHFDFSKLVAFSDQLTKRILNALEIEFDRVELDYLDKITEQNKKYINFPIHPLIKDSIVEVKKYKIRNLVEQYR